MMTREQFEYPVEEWFKGEYECIPMYMREALERYLIDKKPPGDFLIAIITNDLRGAVNRADSTNAPLIPTYVRWLFNRAPGISHGSPQKMQDWLAGDKA